MRIVEELFKEAALGLLEERLRSYEIPLAQLEKKLGEDWSHLEERLWDPEAFSVEDLCRLLREVERLTENATSSAPRQETFGDGTDELPLSAYKTLFELGFRPPGLDRPATDASEGVTPERITPERDAPAREDSVLVLGSLSADLRLLPEDAGPEKVWAERLVHLAMRYMLLEILTKRVRAASLIETLESYIEIARTLAGGDESAPA